MKYVCFTFDDGRLDNFTNVFPITQKYNIRCTEYCVTGFIDGSWDGKFNSADKPLTLEMLKEMNNSGWEIALHGDCHKTELNDLRNCINKMSKWFPEKRLYGFSIPNSTVNQNALEDIISSEIGKNIIYIRKGREINTKSWTYRFLYSLYRFFNFQFAYDLFNKKNVNQLPLKNRYSLCSLVVRKEDNPTHLINFIKKMPDNSVCILMFHSVLKRTDQFYGIDPWTFDIDKFGYLCSEINHLRTKSDSKLEICTVMDFFK
ncbi:polysaccharide deacetylase family protein [Treponema pectinovorum]|uniref:polysaccharide deacetylase family protein n=1 Tax=Treponema pectinovorum TaxID=164 RepID=UPI003D8E650E